MSKRRCWNKDRPPVRRHYEDEQLRSEIRKLLVEALPDQHPAIVAFDGDASTLEATRLIDLEANRPLIDEINRAYFAWQDRFRASAPNQQFNPYRKG